MSTTGVKKKIPVVIPVIAREQSQAFPDNQKITTTATITSATTTARITEFTKTTKITRTSKIQSTVEQTEPPTTREETTSTPWSEVCQDNCYGKWMFCLEGCLDAQGNSNSVCESSCFTNYYECLKSCDLNYISN